MNTLSYSILEDKYITPDIAPFKPVIDGKKLKLAIEPAGLEYSYYNEGLAPILTCTSCNMIDHDGAYVEVEHTEDKIIWKSAYDSFGFEEGDKEHKVLDWKTDAGVDITLPLIFDKKQYKETIDYLLKEPLFIKQKGDYLHKKEMYEKGNIIG